MSYVPLTFTSFFIPVFHSSLPSFNSSLSLSLPRSHPPQITELYATVDNGDSFYVGEDEINVNRGDRFIRVEMTVEQDYGDVLTCISDETSDTATLRIIPGETKLYKIEADTRTNFLSPPLFFRLYLHISVS